MFDTCGKRGKKEPRKRFLFMNSPLTTIIFSMCSVDVNYSLSNATCVVRLGEGYGLIKT